MNSLESQLLYHPYREMAYSPTAVGLSFEETTLQTQDGLHIHGWWIPAEGNAAEASLRGDPRRRFYGCTLLYCHGNGGNISHRLDRARIYHRLGLDQFFFDYRGYGHSEGTPDEAGTYQDAEAAWRYITEVKKVPPEHVVIYGESLGCAVALELALRHPGRALILESPFTSTTDMARRLFPRLPVDSIVQNRYDNLSKIGRLRRPLLIFHSPDDHTVPYAMGRRLFEAAPEPKRFVSLRGSHAFAYHDSGAAYTDALQSFLESLPG